MHNRQVAIFTLLLGILLLVSVSFSDSQTTNLSEWLMYGRYLNHTAWDGVTFTAIPGQNSFNFTNGVPVSSSSGALANGYYYVGDGIGVLHQLNATHIDQRIARFTTGDSYVTSPAVTSSYVYVGSSNHKLYQLNASNITGSSFDSSSFIASFTTGAAIYGGPAVANGSIYVGSYDNTLYQLNASNISQQIASFSTTGAISSTPAISNGYVYIGDQSGFFYQLNASNVSQRINVVDLGGAVSSSSAAVSGNFVYVAGAGDLFQLNASNVSLVFAGFASGDSITSSPAVANGFVYVSSHDANVYQLNASNISGSSGGNDYYAVFSMTASTSSSPTVANGYVYVGGDDFSLYQLNASNITGSSDTSSSFLSSFTTGAAVRAGPAVANGYVYFGSYDHYVYQLNASNLSLQNPFLSVSFVTPTPANGSTAYSSDVPVSLSLVSYPLENYTFVDLDNSLVLWLTMDNFTSTPIDSSTFGETINNVGVSQTGQGRWGKAAYFDGSSRLTFSRPVEDDFTVCAWIKTTTVGRSNFHYETAPVFEAESANIHPDFGFGVGSGGTMVFGDGDQDIDTHLVGNAVVNDNSWHFVCGRRTLQSGQLDILVDGVLDATTTGSTLSLTTQPTAMIGDASDGGVPFTGYIDDVLVFNRVLSDGEILSLNGSASYEHTFTGLATGVHSITGFSVNLMGFANNTENRSFIVAPAPARQGQDSSRPRISLSLNSTCNSNTIGTNVSGSSVTVMDMGNSEVILSSVTDEKGEATFESCGRSVRISASKNHYRSSTQTFTLDSCSCLNPLVAGQEPPILIPNQDQTPSASIPENPEPPRPSAAGQNPQPPAAPTQAVEHPSSGAIKTPVETVEVPKPADTAPIFITSAAVLLSISALGYYFFWMK